MRYDFDKLYKAVASRLSEKRYMHTLGVEKAAIRLSERLMPECDAEEMRAAALLHDITKEMDLAEQISLVADVGIPTTDEDKSTKAAYHAISATAYIEKYLPDFATDAILSAVRKHTLGDSEMSVFDKIIFIADYIEDGRTYAHCRYVREFLYTAIAAEDYEERIKALNRAVLMSLEFTVTYLAERGYHVHSKTLDARSAIKSLI